jgi:ABC-2 type transport system permease protein
MQVRWHVIKAVFKRNFLSYFAGVIGYLFIVAFVGLGSFLAFSPKFFANNLANLDQLNQYFPLLLLFIVPAISMGAWADERKQGTDELLFTIPAADTEILLGKYLAVLGVYTAALLFSLSHVAVLRFLGKPDIGLLFTTYFGYWLSGAALLSAGMVASILTNSPTVAYVLGAAICSVPVFIDRLASSNRLLQGLSVAEQLKDFSLGMIPLGGLLYFVSLTLFMLYLNLVLISRRHWSGGPQRAPMGLHFLGRAVSLGVILISLNVVAANGNTRVDATSEKVYSISATTRKVIAEIKPDTPVLIQAFISPEVPKELVATRTTLIGLLRQLDQQGGDRIRVRISDTEKFSDQADQAKSFGIEPQEMQSERGGRITRDEVYMGVVVTGSVDDEVTVPFFDVGTPVELELTRAIRTVFRAKRLKVGILKTDAKAVGGLDMATFRQSPEWRFVTELKRQYEVTEIDPNSPLLGKSIDVLVAIMPSSLTEPEMKNFVDYVQHGGATLILDDPFPMFHGNLAPHMPKPQAGGMGGMFGQQQGQQPKADNGEARSLTRVLEIDWNSGQTVYEREYDPHPELTQAFERFNVVYVGGGSGSSAPFSERSEITKGLQEMMLFYPGTIRPRQGSKFTFTPLLRTSTRAAVADWDDYIRGGGPFGMMDLIPDPVTRQSSDEHVVAAHITSEGGKAGDKDDPHSLPTGKVNVVFVADSDIISNEFFFVRDKNWEDLRLDNITFVFNAIDVLAGESTYLDLRKRRQHLRSLAQVENLTKRAKHDRREEEKGAKSEADKKLKEAQDRLNAEAKKIREDKNLDDSEKVMRLRLAEQDAQRKLDVEKAKIEQNKDKAVKVSQSKAEREIRKIEDGIRIYAILFPPIPAFLLGLWILGKRIKDEREGIIPDRLVKKT